MGRTTLTGSQIKDDTIALGTDTSGTLPVNEGGTGATDAATARTNLGIPAGSNKQVQFNNSGILGGTDKLTIESDHVYVNGDIKSWGGIYNTGDTGAKAIHGSHYYLNGAYFNVTGKNYSGFPGKGSAEFIIGQDTGATGVKSVYKLVSQDYLGGFTNRMLLEGATGRTGFGVDEPTATVHIKAGAAAANGAPLKLTSGTALTTPEDGAVEYHGGHLYFTIGTTRRQIDQQSDSARFTTAFLMMGA